MMRLVVEQGKLAGMGFDLERPAIVIGRGQDCDIILDEHQVSRRHARLQQTPQGWTLTDLGSTNGTQVNGRPLAPHQPYTLQPGDRVSLGAAVLVLKAPATDGPQAAQSRAGASKGKPRPALLVVGALLIALLVVGAVVALVLVLQDKEEETAPAGVNPLDQLDEVIEGVPTMLEGIVTALPALPTQLEELTTALPIPTDLKEMGTALPVPTQLEELITAIPELPPLPMQAPSTPEPDTGAAQ